VGTDKGREYSCVVRLGWVSSRKAFGEVQLDMVPTEPAVLDGFKRSDHEAQALPDRHLSPPFVTSIESYSEETKRLLDD
jgi:hypothetical protein